MSCWRSTRSRIACRTLTSLNGAWSTRMVNGVIAPVRDLTVRTLPSAARAASCGPSRAPAPWITPVVSAFCREALSLKSMIVTEST